MEDVVLSTVGMCQGPSLTKVQLEEANEAMVEALNNNGGPGKRDRGKYTDLYWLLLYHSHFPNLW